MKLELNPISVGLTPRDRVLEISSDQVALVIDRKSRIIMADGRRILAKVRKIQSIRPDVQVNVMTNTPMCSKTRSYLAENEIQVVPL